MPPLSSFRLEKFIRIICHVFFVYYIILSIVYCKERVIYLDTANYLFNIIQSGLPNISGRPVALLTQILPLILLKFEFPLKAIILSYSLNFSLLFYSVFLLCTYILKNTAAGLIILLSLCLCVRDTFYYPVTEIFQGVIYSALFYAWLFSDFYNKLYQTQKYLSIIITILIILLCYYTHPVCFFLIVFILGYKIIEQKDRKLSLSLIALSLVLFVGKALLTSETAGGGREYKQLLNLMHNIPLFFQLFPIKFLINHSWQYSTIYLLADIMILLSLLHYFITKNYLKSLWILMSILVFLLVNGTVYAKGESGIILEKSLIPCGFFAYLSFIHDVFFKIKFNKYLLIIFILCILLLRFRDISKTAKTHLLRSNELLSFCEKSQQLNTQKLIIHSSEKSRKYIHITWAMPYETLLISSLSNPEEAITCIDIGDFQLQNTDLGNQYIFLHPKFSLGISDTRNLNSAYFNLKPCKYKMITYSQF